MEDETNTITIIELSIMINSTYSIMDSSICSIVVIFLILGNWIFITFYHHYELSRSIGIITYYNCDKLWEYSVEHRGLNGEKVKQQQSQAYLLVVCSDE